MNSSLALITAGTLFGLVGCMHLLRLIFKAKVVVAGKIIPFWVSVVGFIIPICLSIWMFLVSFS